jgi:methionyl-tRNA formyltransferase
MDLSTKKIFSTLFVYGMHRFFKTAVIVMFNIFRGGKVKTFLESHGASTQEVKNVNDHYFINYLRSLDLDIIIPNNCPLRLKQEILRIPKKGAINLHLGKLPAYLGVFPILHAIVNEEKSFGLTVHFMDPNFDNGDIIVQTEIPINPRDNLFTLYPKAFEKGADLMIKAVRYIQEGNVRFTPNGPEGKSYYSYHSIKKILKYHRIRKKGF